MKVNRNTLNWTAVAAFCALLLVGSVVSIEGAGSKLGLLIQGRDKILHAMAYAILAVLACRAVAKPARGAWAYLALGVLFATSYGALLEGLQAGLARRNCSVADAAANALGAGAGGLVWLATITLDRRRSGDYDCRFNTDGE
jgi:VanZ family protein